MATANLNVLGRELTVTFDHEEEAGGTISRCSYWNKCQKTGVTFTVTVTGVRDRMTDIAPEDRLYAKAKMKVERQAQHGKVLCWKHYGKLVLGKLHRDKEVKLHF
jgi:hypothetical protein